MAAISTMKAILGEKKIFNKKPIKKMERSNLNKNIMIIGPRYFRSSIKMETSFAAKRRNDSAHKNGDTTIKVNNAPNAFPYLKPSTNGKIYLEESNMAANMITEKITSWVR